MMPTEEARVRLSDVVRPYADTVITRTVHTPPSAPAFTTARIIVMSPIGTGDLAAILDIDPAELRRVLDELFPASE